MKIKDGYYYWWVRHHTTNVLVFQEIVTVKDKRIISQNGQNLGYYPSIDVIKPLSNIGEVFYCLPENIN